MSILNTYLRLSAGLLMLMAGSACQKKETIEFTDSPVIDAYLKPGDYLNVKISRQTPFSEDVIYSEDDINRLTVSMTDNAGTYVLQAVGDGTYVDSSTTVKAGQNYSLSFQFNEKEVKAYTYIPTRPQGVTQSVTELYIQQRDSTMTPGSMGTMPDPVKISWNNTDNSYYLVLVENTESNPESITNFSSGNAPARVFRKSPSNGSSEEIRSMEFQYFGKTRIILYHVLPDYASLYNQSSTSSQNLTNPSTSILNGYGIFTGLNSDTLWLDVLKK